MEKQTAEWQILIEYISELDSNHIKHVLLRNFASTAKANYALRNIPYIDTERWTPKYDEILRQAIEGIVSFNIDDNQMKQVGMSIRNGGMGLKSAYSIHSASYISRTTKADTNMHLLMQDKIIKDTNDSEEIILTAAIMDYNSKVLPVGIIDEESKMKPMIPISQKSLCQNIDISASQLLYRKAKIRRKAQLKSIMAARSGSWMTITPNRFFGESYSNPEYNILIKRLLGEQLLIRSSKCSECDLDMNQFADHGLTCAFSKGRIYKHDAIVQAISKLLNQSNVEHEIELIHLNNKDNKGRPADIFIKSWKNGKNYAIDIGVTCPTKKSTIKHAKDESLYAANKYYNAKMQKFNNNKNTANADYIYLPLIFEDSGAVHTKVKDIIKRLATLRAANRNVDKSRSIALCRRIILAKLMKCNAIAIANHISSTD